ncbi:MAG TPA: cob(I)yrinic acid a,c-diamide adenosyltransferase [Gallionella sp.]
MRLTKITTRTGDDGTTGLADGTRMAKDHPRITALGSIDELNSNLAVLLAEQMPSAMRSALIRIQNDLFDLGGALATLQQDAYDMQKIAWLDEQVERNNADLPPLREFILPGGHRAAALCHQCRTVARRAERDLVALSHGSTVPGNAIPYLNRLSDLLFVLARQINREKGVPEALWQSKK